MRTNAVVIFLAVLAAVLVGAVCFERYLVPDNDAEFSAAIKSGDLSRFRMDMPKSGRVRIYRIGATPNTLKIDASNSMVGGYYLRLVDVKTGHQAVDFFVRGGDTQTVPVPNGVFRLHEASGNDWYGYTRLFGPETKYTESQTNMVFNGGEHYVLRFNVENGNVTSTDINKRKF